MRYLRRGTVTTAALLLLFVMIVGYAGILAPHRPLFGWFRVVPLEIDRVPGDPIPHDSNIFFLEASCSTNHSEHVQYRAESGLVMSARAACAIEAAASAHPLATVYYVHTCDVDVERMWQGAAPAYALAAISLPNVYVLPVRFSRVFERTPLREQASWSAMTRAQSPTSRATDLLRFYLLSMYGGLYLDSDVFVLQSFWREEDFACAESEDLVSPSALHFSWNRAGRNMAVACMADLLSQSDSSNGGSNVVTRSMQKVCGVNKVSEMTAEKCGGFRLLPSSKFYPVASEQWLDFFHEDDTEDTMKAINNSYAVHMWNHLSSVVTVDTSSQQPYAQIVRRVCPNVVAAVGDFM